MLRSLSNYDLVYELLHDGNGEIYPNLEPIDPEQLYSILQERSGCSFDNDLKKVLNWFMFTDGTATDEEKKNLKIILKIINVGKKALEKIEKENNQQGEK
jgi:hypothetical protein